MVLKGWNINFRLEYPIRKNRTTFSDVLLRRFSLGGLKKSRPIYFPTGFPGKGFVNGNNLESSLAQRNNPGILSKWYTTRAVLTDRKFPNEISGSFRAKLGARDIGVHAEPHIAHAECAH